MTVYENQRQCGGAGSSSSSRCGVFPGTEASRRSGPSRRSQSLQREALEVCLAGGWRCGPGGQAPSWSRTKVVRTPAARADHDFERRPSSGWLLHRLVDHGSRNQSGQEEVPRFIPSRPCGSDSTRPGFQSAEAATSGPRTRRGGHRAVAKARLATDQKKPGDVAPVLYSLMKLVFACSR